jgi:type IV pilus assembly protein PilW
MSTTCRNPKGFTLVELMVAIALAMVVMTMIYTAYRAQAASYRAQEGAVDMMQNARAAMFYMQRALRMSGFDPQRTAGAGFVADLPSPYSGLGAATNSVGVAFTVDDDEDGALDSSSAEIVAFRLDGSNRLQRLMIDPGNLAGSWETLAENVDALDFVYLDGADPPNVLTPPLSAAQLAAIRSVEVSLVVRSEEEPIQKPVPQGKKQTPPSQVYLNQQGDVIFDSGGDGVPRSLLSSQVACRNLGL